VELEIDAIVLDTEFPQTNRMPSRNPFDALSTIFGFMADRIEYQNIKIVKFMAEDVHAKINLFYTPTVLTTNSLIFNGKKCRLGGKQALNLLQINQNEIP